MGKNEHSHAKSEDREWQLLSAEEKHSCQPGILYSANISSKNEGEIEPFADRPKQRGFITGRPALDEMSQ